MGFSLEYSGHVSPSGAGLLKHLIEWYKLKASSSATLKVCLSISAKVTCIELCDFSLLSFHLQKIYV